MRYSGSVYRPPSEAHSLIVQATLGCSHNKCAFCHMYKDKTFSIRPIDEVMEDLAWARKAYPHIERVFLADGDALILPMEHLMRILDFIRQHFPECGRVAVYASTKSIQRKTDSELRRLREAGLGIAYVGLESGNEALLLRYCKGVTAQEIIEAALRLKGAGIAVSVTAINGMGGTEHWEEHARDTAAALSQMKPEFMALLTLRVYQGTPLADWIAKGELVLPDPIGLVRETRLLLQEMDCEGSVFRSNHASNYLALAGTMNRDREAMLAKIDHALRSDGRDFRRFVELGY